MIDLAYAGGSALFFALMLAYVRVCDRLGHDAAAAMERREESTP